MGLHQRHGSRQSEKGPRPHACAAVGGILGAASVEKQRRHGATYDLHHAARVVAEAAARDAAAVCRVALKTAEAVAAVAVRTAFQAAKELVLSDGVEVDQPDVAVAVQEELNGGSEKAGLCRSPRHSSLDGTERRKQMDRLSS